jgi:hypothetical protein
VVQLLLLRAGRYLSPSFRRIPAPQRFTIATQSANRLTDLTGAAFIKPNISEANATHATWHGNMTALYRNGNSFLILLDMPSFTYTFYGAPRRMCFNPLLEKQKKKILLRLLNLDVFFTKCSPDSEVWLNVTVTFSEDGDPVLLYDLQWFQKTPSRLPEAIWLTFNPLGSLSSQWFMASRLFIHSIFSRKLGFYSPALLYSFCTFSSQCTSSSALGSESLTFRQDKLGTLVSPLEVVLNGSQHQHGVWSGVFLEDYADYSLVLFPLLSLSHFSALRLRL